MSFFDFHHHKLGQNGIYNQDFQLPVIDSYFSIGIHPKDITNNWKKDFDLVKEKSLQENCLAIGECGLDGLISIDDNLQEDVFREHINWAKEIQKPVIIHCVRRFSQLLKFKKEKLPLIMHGFNKKKSIADEMQNAGFYLSFGKAVLDNLSLQLVIKDFPINRLFLETDDADFDIQLLYQKVSDLKSISIDELNIQIWENLNNIENYG